MNLTLFFCPVRNLENVKYTSLEDIRKVFRAYVKTGNIFVHDDYFLDFLFSYTCTNGKKIVSYMLNKKFTNIVALPDPINSCIDNNSFTQWFKTAKKIAKVPATVTIPVPMSLYDLVKWQGYPLCYTTFKRHIEKISDDFGYSFFLRTDYKIHEHNYEGACFIQNKGELIEHITELIKHSFIRDIPYTAFVFQKLIDANAAWYVKQYGNMPVRREFYIFIEDGKINYIQPYWLPKLVSILDEKPDNWQELLETVNTLTYDDVKELQDTSLAICKNLRGNWAFHYLAGKDGWYLINMSLADYTCKYIYDKKMLDKYMNLVYTVSNEQCRGCPLCIF